MPPSRGARSRRHAAVARAYQPPVPQTFKLANGLTVILNERSNLPIVNAALVFRTGSDANPTDKPGLANFTVAMLDEGTKSRNSLQLADDVAQLGAMLSTSSAMDNSTAGVSVLKRNFPAAMQLLADVVLNPTFPAEEVERQRGQRLSQLVEERQEPGVVAAKALAAALYGPRHPYGYSELGTEAATKAMSRDDMLAFWTGQLRAEQRGTGRGGRDQRRGAAGAGGGELRQVAAWPAAR